MSKSTMVIATDNDTDFERLKALVTEFGIKPVRAKRMAELCAFGDAGVELALVDLTTSDFSQDAAFEEFERLVKLGWVARGAVTDAEIVKKAMRSHCVDWVVEGEDEAGALKSAFLRVERRLKKNFVSRAEVEESPRARALVKEIAKRIREGNIDLPEIPQVVVQLNQLLGDPEVSADKVVAIVEKDPSLAARIVATANAATYGGQSWTKKITDLSNAVTRMGNMAVRNLVQTEALKNMFQFRSPAFKAIFDKMWQTHVLVAKVAREIANERQKENADEAYLWGLLHNIGELFLLRVFGEFFQRHKNQILSMDEVLSMVREWHPVFGAGLIKKWELGADLELLAKVHHTPSAYTDESLTDDQKEILYTVALANQLSSYSGKSYYAKAMFLPGIQECYEALSLSNEMKDNLREKLPELLA